MKEIVFTTHQQQKLVCLIWNTVKNPVGVVQIIDGINDTVSQYNEFAKFLNKNGYIVFVTKHDISYLRHTDNIPDIFMKIVSDEIKILKYLKQKYKLPVFLFGNGYGSFITQRVMECTDLCTAGVCLANGAHYPRYLLRIGAMLAWLGQKIYGANTPTKLLNRFLPIWDLNAKSNKKLSYSFYYSLFHNLIQISYNVNCNTPILIISTGTNLNYNTPRLANALYKTYQAHNIENLTIICYPDSGHKLNNNDVQRDILEFFDSVTR